MTQALRLCAVCAVALGLAACESTEDAAKKISAKGQAAFNAKGLSVTQTDKALKDPAMKEALARGATEGVGGAAVALAKLAREDSDKYARIVKEVNIKLG